MAKTNFTSVDEYIASQPEAAQGVLKLNGRAVLYFAGWKRHYSLYPATDRAVAAFKDPLAPYEVNKGTISFPLSEPVPVQLIEGIAKFRAKEVAERTKATASAPKKRYKSRTAR